MSSDAEKDESEIQFYGFSIAQFVDDHAVLVENQIEVVVEKLLQDLSKKLKADSINSPTIAAQLNENFKAALSESTSNFESLLNKYLGIGPNIPIENLESYGKVSAVPSSEGFRCLEELKQSFEKQRTTYLENKYLIKALQSELAVLEEVKGLYNAENAMKEQLSTVNDSPTSPIVEQIVKDCFS